MRAGVLVLSVIVGCGASPSSEVLDVNAPGDDAPSTIDGAEAPPAETANGEASAVDPPGDASTESDAAACTSIAFYRDQDGDGVGGTERRGACDPPGPGWVTSSGDCDDKNRDVFPGQTAFFVAPHTSAGVQSFDYDCSGTEDQELLPPRAAGAPCSLDASKTACTGGGYQSRSTRTPPALGSDAMCGAVVWIECRVKKSGSKISCEEVATQAPATACR